MNKFFTFFSIASLLYSCNTTKATFVKGDDSVFTAQEQNLIFSGKEDEPMRVLQLYNRKDSIVLRSKSSGFLLKKNDTVLDHFTKRLYATVRDSATRGVGIAAPQVGVLKRIIWVQRLDKEDEPFEVYYNPLINKYSDLKQDVPEGCLSIKGVRGTTHDRAYAVFFEYDNRQGEHKCEMVEAFTAAIFQHEIDHLEGIMFVDHLEQEKKNSNHKL